MVGEDGEEYILVRRSEWEAPQRENAELRSQVAALTARIAELEERLRTSPRNSSKPPSSNPPWTQRQGKPEGKKGKRRRGGQPGHPPAQRELLPPEEVDRVVDCPAPTECGCGGRVAPDGSEPERHQQCELPPIKPFVTEFRLGAGICERCGKRHRGGLPEGVSRGLLGPRALALVALLSGVCRLSRRCVVQLLQDLFGLSVCLGTVSNAEAKASAALAEPVDELRVEAQQAQLGHADETGHKQAGRSSWLSVLVTTGITVFMIHVKRNTEAAKALLGKTFAGYLVSDRWGGYNWVDLIRRQFCWAHLERDFKKVSERKGLSQKVGEALVELTHQLFHIYHRVRDGTISHTEFVTQMAPIKAAVEEWLETGSLCGHPQTEKTCLNLLRKKVALWTFVSVPGMEPTNNIAERALRFYVLWRKGSFGTQSERGNRFVERILTVNATCRQQHRNVLEYLTAAIEANLANRPAPSLLPTHQRGELALAA